MPTWIPAAPAARAAPDPSRLPADTPINLFAAWWLPLTEGMPRGAVWAAGVSLAVALLLVPLLARRPRRGNLAPSVVDPRLCTGCNQCPQDCPWEAITMVAREDDRPTLVALLNPERCVSCGICAGSCAPMGVGPPGRTGRDQLSAARLVAGAALAGPEAPAIIAICCGQAPDAQVEALRARGAHVHPVTCVGNLHTSVVELLVRSGAGGRTGRAGAGV